ncbi:MAG TPA: glycerol kinase GlpK, partial [Trueperaceae bacterium]|nr:glycerol kinase GlpK [Trueperaceae bacterium]
RRTAGVIDALRADGVGDVVRAKTGLELDPYFSASKVAWLLDAVPDARARAEAGELAFGTVDTWLAARLTQGQVHVTDVSNASRTSLFDIDTLAWDPELLELFKVPAPVLPTVVPSSGEVAIIERGPLAGVPLAALAGDQQAATFGQACFTPGQAKNTYGTGCFLMLNTGRTAVGSSNGLLTTIGWQVGASGAPEYALEGSIFTAGAVVQWLRDGLKVIRSADEVEALATSVTDSGGVTFVPALTGLGAPHWDPYARGTVLGISRGTTAAHLARAALEGIAFQVADIVDALRQDSGLDLSELKVDGGASRNDTLMQHQADLLGLTVTRPLVTETTALGAAFLAGLAVGLWRDQEEVAGLVEPDRVFEPNMDASERRTQRARWSEAVERSKGWDQV